MNRFGMTYLIWLGAMSCGVAVTDFIMSDKAPSFTLQVLFVLLAPLVIACVIGVTDMILRRMEDN